MCVSGLCVCECAAVHMCVSVMHMCACTRLLYLCVCTTFQGSGTIGMKLSDTNCVSQIYQEAKKFGKVYNIKVVCAYGGGSMWEQSKACQEGAEIIVATPV